MTSNAKSFAEQLGTVDIGGERSHMWSQEASVLLRLAPSLLTGLRPAMSTMGATVKSSKAAKDVEVDAASEDANLSSLLCW